MKKVDIISVLFLSIIYFLSLFFRTPHIFTYRFPLEVVQTYLHSQDITHEVAGRVFISDSDGSIALGYLYIHGGDPVWYNFQHGPFIKYLYGFAIHYWGNPYVIQILFGLLLLVVVYLFGKQWSSPQVGLLAGLFLVIDPLFITLSSQFLLDLGQTALLLLYLYLVLFHKKAWLAQGMVLGVLCASKFWAAPLFFFMLIHGFLFLKKKFDWRQFSYHVITAFITFTLVYIRSFIVAGGFFNIIFFELKVLKFWFTQSVSSYFGATLLLFISGYFQQWWGDRSWARSEVWSFLWPILLVINGIYGGFSLKKRHFTWRTLFVIIPILYLLYMGVQTPFERYFIIILPFLYLTVSQVIVQWIMNKKRT